MLVFLKKHALTKIKPCVIDRLIASAITIFSVITIGCTPEKVTNVDALNGYWEIKSVRQADGTEKTYNFNKLIDFFEIKDSIGLRKKVQPTLNGRFKTAGKPERFVLRIENKAIRLHYKTNLMLSLIHI